MSKQVDEIVRFSTRERVEHALVLILFFALALTGLPQKFHDASVSRVIVYALGGITQVRYLHRVSGALFSLLVVAHLTAVLYAVVTRRSSLSMVPRPKDFRDVVIMLRYYLRLSDQRPQFDRFDYKEKFEYWGLVFGSFIMICTGLLLRFPLLATQVLPGEVIPAAKVAHGNEGLMAFLVVVVWHLYNVVLAPEIFPLNKTIFTGRISRERMRHEHPLEYARRFPEEGDPGALDPAAPKASSKDDG
jgi:formate dehydrogenase subunit gamma